MKTVMIAALAALFLLAGCVEDQLDVTKETGSTQGELAQFALTMSPETPKAQEQTTFSLSLPTGFTAEGFSCGVEDQDNQQEERCGDFDHDDSITQSDIDYLTDYMFTGGPAPNPIHIANVDGEDQVDIGDLTYLVDFLYNNGANLDCQALENQPGIQIRVYEEQYYCVDIVDDNQFDEQDINSLVSYMFEGGAYPGERADFNRDGEIDIADLVGLSQFFYGNGAAPSCPTIENNQKDDVMLKSGGQEDETTVPDDEVMADDVGDEEEFACGDVNGDGDVDDKDLQFLSNYMFTNGQAPSDLYLANVNGEGMVDISDLTHFVSFIHHAGPALNCAEPEDGSYNGVGREANCGDVQANGLVDSGDVAYAVDYMFTNGPAPEPLSEGDVTGDGVVDISDLTSMVQFVYHNGPDFVCQSDDDTVIPEPEGITVEQDCGDLTEDGLVSKEDVDYLTAYMFEGGNAPPVMWKADVNSDGQIDISDITNLVDLVYGDQIQALICTEPTVNDIPAEDNFDGAISGEDNLVIPDEPEDIDDTPEEQTLPGDIAGEDQPVIPDDVVVLNDDTCGDLNNDGKIDDLDLDFLTSYMFEGGLAPSPLWTADVDGSSQIDISDVTYLVDYVHEDGPAPDCPEQTTPERKELIYSTKDGSSALMGAALAGILSSCEINGGCSEPVSVCGDINGDTVIDDKDYQYLSNYMFMGGPAPTPLWGADVDGSGELDIADLTFLVAHVERNGPEPSCDGNPQVEIDAFNQCGDMNGDSFVDSKDIRYLAAYMFEDGGFPISPANGDVDGDNIVTISDVVYLIDYLYDEGSAPSCTTQAQLQLSAKSTAAETLSFVCRYPATGSYSATLQYTDAGESKTLIKTVSVS